MSNSTASASTRFVQTAGEFTVTQRLVGSPNTYFVAKHSDGVRVQTGKVLPALLKRLS